MSKIYYSVDAFSAVHWLDASGVLHRGEGSSLSPLHAGQDFKVEHPGAVFLQWPTFCTRLARLEADREKLAAWNGGKPL